MEEESPYEKNLGGALLADVSRSFYLTLKALPKQLREPISLAYLLARTADTIADTAEVTAKTRLECLDMFSSWVQSREESAKSLAKLLEDEFHPHQSDHAEARLMKRVPEVLSWLATMQGNRLLAIKAVLKHIIEGQKADIIRFPGDGRLCSLETVEELDWYTWQVAGCVGEFWTDVCFSELDSAFVSGADLKHMRDLGARYGKGLQLVNILRDIGKDASMGRCYLPKAEWKTLGIHEDEVATNPAVLRPVWELWAAKASAYLDAGLEYTTSLANARLRYATALPVLLGIKTLNALKKASDAELVAGVKIGRLEVAKLLMQVSLNNSAAGICKLAAR